MEFAVDLSQLPCGTAARREALCKNPSQPSVRNIHAATVLLGGDEAPLLAMRLTTVVASSGTRNSRCRISCPTDSD